MNWCSLFCGVAMWQFQHITAMLNMFMQNIKCWPSCLGNSEAVINIFLPFRAKLEMSQFRKIWLLFQFSSIQCITEICYKTFFLFWLLGRVDGIENKDSWLSGPYWTSSKLSKPLQNCQSTSLGLCSHGNASRCFEAVPNGCLEECEAHSWRWSCTWG